MTLRSRVGHGMTVWRGKVAKWGAGCLFEGAVQPENGCNMVKKGKKQVAKSQKNVQKVCKKHAKRRHFTRFLHFF